MQTWESLFGLESLSKLNSLSFQNDVIQDSEENSVLLSLRAGLRSALKHVAEQRAMGKTVYPPDADIFNAFKLTSPDNLKVVIIGQDPYHGENQAHGLCFSVLKGNKIPPSLRNIYKELSTDIPNFESPEHGDLSHWAEQGVLLLNTVLSVEHAQAHSHKKVGWELFTDSVISTINNEFDNVVFLLWGSPAQKKAKLIDRQRHFILDAVHPSPLSAHRGFFGCKHFSKTNELLESIGKKTIDWQPK
jgi:uracil-DNA glycosylase